MLRRFVTGLLIVAVSPVALGCGASLSQTPIETEAPLGKVVIYRNGVAYFERRATVDGDRLRISVPSEKVDDFLKSLTVSDAKSGQPLPVAFPTLDRQGDDAEMVVQLPKKGHYDLAIHYVTESPAWKPSYRIVLEPDGKARLQAWAVVDNVSGEDWKKIKVGVGSTSALSFRYDLHSVRLVERETLTDGALEALAPPTGGSPYAVASREVQVVGNIRMEAVEDFTKRKVEVEAAQTDETAGAPAAARMRQLQGGGSGTEAPKHDKKTPGHAASGAIARSAAVLRAQGQKVRVEGFAKTGDADPNAASLERANAVKDQLVQNGVPADRIDVVGTGRYSERDGARVLSLGGDGPAPSQPQSGHDGIAPGEPIGSAYFLASEPMTIEKDHSAMISLLEAPTRAEQVYFFDPISSRGSKRFAFKAALLENPSAYTLDSGPVTVYADGQFLGEGLSEPIPPKSRAFIPFALDRKIVIEPLIDTREEIDRLVTIQRGVVMSEMQQIRRTKLAIANQGEAPAKVWIRHAVPEGYTLRWSKTAEKLGGAYLFPITVSAHGATTLEIEESTPVTRSLDINSEDGVKAISLWLEKAARIEPSLKQKLEEIVKLHRSMQDTQARIETVQAQMHEYRTRVDEINVQLVTLRKVTHAQELSRHLAKKMQEISERLQTATIQVTDLEGQLMTNRVDLQDKLADLTLEKKDEPAAVASKP